MTERPNNARQELFERALTKPTRTVICSSPYTARAVNALIGLDKVMGNIQTDYANSRINGTQYNQACQRVDGLIRSFESEIHNIRNQARQRNRPNRPEQKPPKVRTAGAPQPAKVTVVSTAAAPPKAEAPSAVEAKPPKAAKPKKKIAAAG